MTTKWLEVEDGLYRVVYKGICAGFIAADGRITRIAPILRSKINFWVTIATKVNTESEIRRAVR